MIPKCLDNLLTDGGEVSVKLTLLSINVVSCRWYNSNTRTIYRIWRVWCIAFISSVFLRLTRIFILEDGRGLPLWSGGQSSWLHNQSPGFDSRRYHIFWEVVGLERGPLSLLSTNEELLGRKSSGLRSRNPRLWPQGIRRPDYATPLYPQTLALTSSTSGGRSVGIFRSWTKATELILFIIIMLWWPYVGMCCIVAVILSEEPARYSRHLHCSIVPKQNQHHHCFMKA
jgi:hypothetical protein